jgi:acyl dehydratase
LSFKAPVYLNDTIVASVELTKFNARSRVATFRTTCINQDGVSVIEGEAVVIAPLERDGG